MTYKVLSYAALVSIALAPAAIAAPKTLAGCYDLVIDSCNATSSHPQQCASSGMDQCDEQFNKGSSKGSRLNGIRAHQPLRSINLKKDSDHSNAIIGKIG